MQHNVPYMLLGKIKYKTLLFTRHVTR